MKNCISCCGFNTKSDAKFIDPDGNQRRIEVPAKAAELMLESPGYVVVPVENMRKTRWVHAMGAEEELEAGKMYVMLTARRANFRASDGEMAAVKDAMCRKKGKRQVYPMVEMRRESISKDDAEDDVRDSFFPGHRLSNYRQWKPDLETIDEEI